MAEEEDSGWDGTTVADLAKLFSNNLHTCFHNAVKKMSENGGGYSKKTAEETVLKCGPFYGIKEDMVSTIVDRALDCLETRRSSCPWYAFNDINSLVEYMMLEMVTMLRYVRPSLSVHEAIWTLLICDLSLLVASEADIIIDPHNLLIPTTDRCCCCCCCCCSGKQLKSFSKRLQSLQKQVKSWDDWASVKVMQVAKRLSEDGAEIKRLKAEKAEAESRKKKLSEMTATLDCQFQMSSSTIARLESENSVLKRDKERAENRSLIEAKSLEEALCKELEALNKSELCGSEKKLLEEDLKSLKRGAGPKQRDLERAKHLLKETETRLAREEQQVARLHEEAESIRNERQGLQQAGEGEGDERAGKELKKFQTEIKRIQYEIAAFNLEAESKKNGVLISWQGTNSRSRNDECVMCLTKEMTVLFVPCGHQVLCAECNVIHEDNGMKECPSCRTPIQKRINCVFAKLPNY